MGTGAHEVDEPSTPMVKDVYTLWQAACGSEEFPKQRDIGAHVLQAFTPNVYIIDVLDGGQDFAIRFMGSAIAHALGTDFTGIRFSENPSHPATWRTDIYRMAVATRVPMFTHVALDDFDRGHIQTECGLFPVADKNGVFNMILCCAARM